VRVSNHSLATRALLAVVACWAATAVAGGNKDAARSCAASPAELAVVPLEHRGKITKKAVLGKKSECLVLTEGGNRPAVLFELPSFTQSYSVNVRSALLGTTVLVPRVDVLDAQKVRRRSLGLHAVRRRGDSLELDVFVTKNDAEDRYLVVYSDPDASGQGESRSSMGTQTIYVANTFWVSGTENNVEVKYVENGVLVLTLKGPQWDKK